MRLSRTPSPTLDAGDRSTSPPRAVPPAVAHAPAQRAGRVARIPAWYVGALLVAVTSVVAGIIWDISWHLSIGRDTFWTPAHLTIYAGGIIGGLASGALVLSTTFGGDAAERESAVRIWGFRGPLGAWLSIWGALAMLTSAPFDNWWHSAYGLDVEILSPPHIVLALGMVALALGAMLVLLAQQNRDGNDASARFAWMYTWAAGCVLSLLAITIAEYSFAVLQHSTAFYIAAALALPLFLAAAGNASRLRWGTTAIAAVYMAIRMTMLWILPLFPAHPRLGPIYQHITHMLPMEFPLLLIVPAFFMDLVRHRWGDGPAWRLAAVQGIAFIAGLVGAQWLFSTFLLSPAARGPVFGQQYVPYNVPSTSALFRHEFVRQASGAALWSGLARAAVYAMVATALGVFWSQWLRRVRR